MSDRSKRNKKKVSRTPSIMLSFGDIADLLDGDMIEVPDKNDELVTMRIRRYDSDLKGVDEVRAALEDNFDDDDLDEDNDDDIEDPDDYVDDDEEEGEEDGEEDGEEEEVAV